LRAHHKKGFAGEIKKSPWYADQHTLIKETRLGFQIEMKKGSLSWLSVMFNNVERLCNSLAWQAEERITGPWRSYFKC
jgi:hypothetical protein